MRLWTRKPKDPILSRIGRYREPIDWRSEVREGLVLVGFCTASFWPLIVWGADNVLAWGLSLVISYSVIISGALSSE
jgi:hypothetical protein